LALAKMASLVSIPMISSISSQTRMRIGAGQIDLVQYRKNFQILVNSHIDIGQGLGLDPLGRINNQ
jgi:hypothetical protein